MKRITTLLLALGILAAAPAIAVAQLTEEMRRDGWVSIFDGRTLEGWRANEPGGTGNFAVENGILVGTGGRNHLYFMERLTNFELKIDVKINNDGNSGVYIKSQWQDNAWPTTGFELQVNGSHRDPQKTGSLYDIIHYLEAPHGDDEWFTYHIICNGNRLECRVNGRTLWVYVCPMERGGVPQGDNITPQNKRISQSGYIALQTHHQGSIVQFRNIFLRRLP